MIGLLLAASLYGEPQLLGRLPFEEVSGIAVGAHGTYVHEDSGSGPRFARIDREGQVLARFRLDATARDWEDMAAAPDAEGRPSLWFADVGDNREARDGVQVHRVVEPEGDEVGQPVTARFTYEDGPRDAEALLVLPGGREVAVVTKAVGVGRVYVGPADGGVLRRAATVQLSPTGTRGGPAGPFGQVLVTGGSLVGDRVLLRTYTDLYAWEWAGDVAATFAQAPVVSPLPETRQGEAVAVDGDAVLVASEGAPAPLHRLVPVQPPPSPSPSPSSSRSAPPEAVVESREVRRAVAWAVVGVVGLLLGAVGLAASRRRRARG